MNNKTLEIRITENSFYFREGEIYHAHQDDEAELTGEEHE